jgi:antitoxin component YwqK of YwqJK toxin-antitoxin module
MRYLISFVVLFFINSCIFPKYEIVRDENGIVVRKCELKKGVRHGKCYDYYPNGNIRGIINWIDGVHEGETIEYFENGSVKSVSMWKDGKQHGKLVEYFENGKINATSMWKDDKMEGECVEYFENGNMKSKAIWKDDKLNGECVEYFENGEIRVISFFINDQLIEKGVYDETGRLSKVNQYITINNQLKLNGTVVFDMNEKINYQQTVHAKIFVDSDTINYGGFALYEIKWMCSEDHYLSAFTGNYDHNFNVVDSSSLKQVDLENKNKFYPSNSSTDTLRIIFNFKKIKDGKSLMFHTYLEEVFTVKEK